MKKILIIDTSAVMYRSHFAMQKLMNSKGEFTGATYGFVKQLDIAINTVSPDYIVCAMDVKRKDLKRTKEFSDYKSDRKSMPDELANQIKYIKDIIASYNIKAVSIDSYEADDVIGSISEMAVNSGVEVHIFTGDKDIQQLVRDDKMIIIHFLGKDLIIDDNEKVKEYIDVYPSQIPDLFGLKGDKSDGIPGVMGIGQVYAAKLINKYDNLENIYENIDKISGKLKEKLIKDKNLAFISRKLAVIHKDLELDFTLEDLEYKEKNDLKLKDIYKELELNSLIRELNITDKKEEAEIKENIIDKDHMIKILESKKDLTMYEDTRNLYVITDNNLYYTKTFNLDNVNLKGFLNVYDAKKYMHLGLKLDNNFFDILISAYVIFTESRLDVEDIIFKYLGINIEKYTEAKLKKLTEEEFTDKSIKITKGIYKLKDILKEKIKEEDIENTYENIEKPLISILYQMEKKGIKISGERFLKLNEEFTKLMTKYEDLIYEKAGEKFNIDSPKQLAIILFEKMGIKAEKKVKTGYSTDAMVLLDLSLRGIEIADYILKYREYKKLLTTYVEAIPNFSDENNRVHSVFNGVGTVTGRLSSLNPNLQNIPAKTDNGNKIRSCFIAKDGYKLVSFDYSQIELRVLAELSQDESLIKAYKEDLDLHEQTAREIFNKHMMIEVITKEERNLAKIINFSVLYGKTSYGLSTELKIDISDAKKYIDAYFNKYKKVKSFIDKIIDDATKNGFVTTLYGTKRYINGINSSNSFVSKQASRMAVNTVIQGTAANIIKLVMIELSKKGYNMLVQVHDELIFEIKEENLEKEIKEIKEIMENTIKFKNIKLKVNYNIGDNWGELK
ncbi:DNA polymerase I [Oceanivirga miroungae]|uniref:DNA-directed DNA polymerase n=1 Tax=Oceanivirga miroungae TaxID=1130046 RepID=A0A6I8MDC7_9FUSO|nr:DNA polymerase I [Oceanivirga miroungae]VWL85100.1 DNA polymerase I [Oceanivirga miroungae]